MNHKRVFLLIALIVALSLFSLAREMEPLDSDLVRVYKSLSGPDEAALIHQASLEAVKKCAGRVYSTQNLIMARALLEKYISHNYKKFIYSVDTVEKKYVGDDVALTLNIYVRYDALARDLEEKRFLYQPRYRPYFALFIAETIDGQPSAELLAQNEVLSLLKERAVRLPETGIIYPRSNVDISEEPELMRAAIEAAHKNEIELLISGKSDTRLVKKQQLYYDLFYFYETVVKLKLIRVDTGEILYEQQSSALTYNVDAKKAINNGIAQAARNVVNDIVDFYYRIWDKVFLNKVDYQIMVTGVDEEGIKSLREKIQLLHPEAEVFVRSFFQNVLVLNIVYPGQQTDLEHLLKTSPFPRFRIVRVAGEYIEAQKEH